MAGTEVQEIRQPDKPLLDHTFTIEDLKEKSEQLPYAVEQFRLCSQKKWSPDAWRDWLNWSKAVSAFKGGDYFGSERTIDSRYSVRWSDTKTLGPTPGALHSDQAMAILEKFGLDDLLSSFGQFWSAIHACLQYPRLTPAVLKRDAEVYSGTFHLAERLEEAKMLLRERRLIR